MYIISIAQLCQEPMPQTHERSVESFSWVSLGMLKASSGLSTTVYKGLTNECKISNCSILPGPETAHVQRLSTETRERLLQWSKHTEVPGCSPVGPHHSIVAYLTTAFLYMCWCSFDSLTIPVRFPDKLYGAWQDRVNSIARPVPLKEKKESTQSHGHRRNVIRKLRLRMELCCPV